MSCRVAFASTGEYVDQHFGSARYFQVFDVMDGKTVFVETRKTMSMCQGNCDGGFDHLFQALQDCDAVFASKIGPGAASVMLAKGMRVFEAFGEVAQILLQIQEDGLVRG